MLFFSLIIKNTDHFCPEATSGLSSFYSGILCYSHIFSFIKCHFLMTIRLFSNFWKFDYNMTWQGLSCSYYSVLTVCIFVIFCQNLGLISHHVRTISANPIFPSPPRIEDVTIRPNVMVSSVSEVLLIFSLFV